MNSLFIPLIRDFDAALAERAVHKRLDIAQVEPEALDWSYARRAGVRLDLLPLDRLHPVISGNKWFKLKYNLLYALQSGVARMASCGGAHSNHLHALAWAGKQMGIATWAAVRGEELALQTNPTLADLQDWGMEVQFVSRERYRQWRAAGWQFFPSADTLNVPEGGDNFLGVLGCISLGMNIATSGYSQVHVACGTGCTLLGLRLALPPAVGVIGWSALKGHWQQADMAMRLQQWSAFASVGPWRILSPEQGGRFGKIDLALRQFMQEFTDETGVLLDPVYTGKMLWGLSRYLQQGAVPRGSRVLVVHSGGLQGRVKEGDKTHWNGYPQWERLHQATRK